MQARKGLDGSAAMRAADDAREMRRGATIELEEVGFWRAGRRELDGASLILRANETTALLSAPGAGASALIHAIRNLATPTPNARMRGVIRMRRANGETVAFTASGGAHRVRPRLAWLGPRPMPAAATVFETVADPGAPGLMRTGDDLRRHVAACLDRAGLAGDLGADFGADLSADLTKLDRSTATFGPGALQRLRLARALAAEPEALLLERPCASLSADDAERMNAVLAALKGSVTIVLAADSPLQASRTAHAVALLDGERLTSSGSTPAIFSADHAAELERAVGDDWCAA